MSDERVHDTMGSLSWLSHEQVAEEFLRLTDLANEQRKELTRLRAALEDVARVEAWCMEKPHDREVKFRNFEGPERCWQATTGLNEGPRVWPFRSAPNLAALGAKLREVENG